MMAFKRFMPIKAALDSSSFTSLFIFTTVSLLENKKRLFSLRRKLPSNPYHFLNCFTFVVFDPSPGPSSRLPKRLSGMR